MLRLARALCLVLLLAWAAVSGCAQSITTLGLRSSNAQGAFKAAGYLPDGTLVLLYDQGDGLRLLKTDAAATSVLAEVQQGGPGDTGVGLATDAAGNIYIAGTSFSGLLHGAGAVPFPAAADSSTNSFVAKFSSDLRLQFLTFLGAPRTAVTGIAATADAVFVAGITYSQTFPVTAGAFSQTPASGVHGSGFVERFTADGSGLNYATYLDGVDGDTSPAAIVADASDRIYITGETSAPSFPTTPNALQPQMPGTTAGFLSELNPDGSTLVLSSFIAGTGITGLALDASSSTLLLSGNVSLAQFGLASVASPVPDLPSQAVLRLSVDGQQVLSSAKLLSGTHSSLQAAPDGTLWVAQTLSAPVFPAGTAPLQPLGDTVLLHLSADGSLQSAYRMGGTPLQNAAYASLTAVPGPPAVNADGTVVTLPAAITIEASSSLAGDEPFDLPLSTFSSSLLNSYQASLLPDCSSVQGQCSGSAGLLAILTSASAGAPALSLSLSDLPNLQLRNPTGAEITGLALGSAGVQLSTDCHGGLEPGSGCSLAFTGSGSLTIASADASPLSFSLPAAPRLPSALGFSTPELDFGVVGPDAPVLRTITLTNLTPSIQTFTSAPDGVPNEPSYTLTEVASTCAGVPAAHTLPGNSQCSLTLSLAGQDSLKVTSAIHTAWSLGDRDVVITGVVVPTALAASSSQVDFGTRYLGVTPQTPRFLYLSNNTSTAIAHAAVTLPPGAPFLVTDNCPASLAPHSVCQLAFSYTENAAPTRDTASLTLDDGQTVLIEGQVLPSPASTVSGSSLSTLVAAPASVSFAPATPVTAVSGQSQTITLKNTGAEALPLQIAITGDFLLLNRCSASLGPGATCSLTVQFAPTQPGARAGLLVLSTGVGAQPLYVPLSGMATALLATAKDALDLGQSPIGEPATVWYPVQGNFPSLTLRSTGPAFTVALAPGSGTQAPSLPPSAFATSATGTCVNCWVGVRFLPVAAGLSSGSLNFTSTAAGGAYVLPLTGVGISLTGLILDPLPQGFGTVPVHSASAPLTVVLSNLLSPATSVGILGLSVTGDFQITPNLTGGADCQGTLAPSASCYLQVTFRPTGTGLRSGTLSVATTAGEVTATLNGSGTADTGLALEPSAVKFNAAPGASANTAVVTITNTSKKLTTVSALSSSLASFSIAESTCASLAPGSQCQATIQYTPTATLPSGQLSFSATQGTGPDAVTTAYTLPVTATYTVQASGLLLLPPQADFSPQAAGTTGLPREFTLTNLTAQTATISLRAPQDFPLTSPFACSTLAPGATCTFSVVPVPANGGPLTGSLTATATLPDGTLQQTLSYLLGYGQANGSLLVTGDALSAGLLNFGQVTSGSSATQTLTFANRGETPLLVSRLVATPPFTADSRCGLSLAPGSTCPVSVTYAPVYELPDTPTSLAPRPDTGTLRIESDAASSPDLVSLSGSAAPITATAPSPSAAAAYTLSQGALTFANTPPGTQSGPQGVVVTNTGSVPLQFAAPTSFGDFHVSSSCSTLPPQSSCTLQVLFAPTDSPAGSVRTGLIELSSNATNALEFISLLGESAATPLLVAPTALSFPSTDVGTSSVLPLIITNTSALPLNFALSASLRDYTWQPGSCPDVGAPLSAGQSCTIQLTFTPTAAGARTSSLQITSPQLMQPVDLALTGVGLAPQLSVSASDLNFGSVLLRQTVSLPLIVTNSGSAPLNMLTPALGGADAEEFALGSTCPLPLLPGASCTLAVSFTPSYASSVGAVLTLQGAGLPPVSIPLAGIGLAPPSFVLTVAGESSGTAIVPIGALASFSLLLTPQNGFTGPVALTCTAVIAGPNAVCSLTGSQMIVTGATAQAATADVSTISSIAAVGAWLTPVGLLGSALFSMGGRRRHVRRKIPVLFPAALLLAAFLGISACSSGGGGGLGMRITPPGTYQYRVTANAAGGAPITSSVLLNLTVQQ